MNAPGDNPNAAAIPAGSPVARGILARACCYAFLAVVVIVCGYVAYGSGKLLAEWRRPADSAALRRAEAADLGPLSPALPLAGIWAFDELDWSVRSEWIAAKDVDAHFEWLAAAAPILADEELPDSDPEFLALVAAFGIQPVDRDGNRVYCLERPGLKAQWITRDAHGRTKTAAFAVAYPSDGDEWQLFEFMPRSAQVANVKSHESHLLPMPSEARRSGGRFANDGQVLLEFILLDADADELLAAWNDAGWEVRPSGLAGPADFSYLCARDNEVIYAWSANPPESLHNLMLVRTAAPADNRP